MAATERGGVSMSLTEPAPFPRTDGTQPCAAEDPELFFPSTPFQVEFETPRALAVCQGCPFRRPCLAYALTHDVRGVWGGTTRGTRRRLREEHGITAVPVQILDEGDDEQLLELMERGGGFRPRPRPVPRSEHPNDHPTPRP